MHLNIGDKLYRYVSLSGIHEYEVIGIRISARDTQYEVKSLSCKHGWACELLIAVDDNKQLSFVCMLNNDEEDDQSYWHTNNNLTHFPFFLTKEEVKSHHTKVLIRDKKKEIEKAQDRVKTLTTQLKSLEDLINTLNA